MGGSTTYGRPYDDALSFSGWLGEFLPAPSIPTQSLADQQHPGLPKPALRTARAPTQNRRDRQEPLHAGVLSTLF